MSLIKKEYDIPFLGKVQLLRSSMGFVESFNGKYYASNKILGESFCTHSNNLEELKEKVNKEIINYFKIRKKIAEQEIKEEEKRINKLECHLSESKQENWFEKYQTDNPLQEEYQKKRKIKWN